MNFSNNIDFNCIKDPWIFIYLAKSNYEVYKNYEGDSDESFIQEEKLQKTAAFLNLAYKISKKEFLIVSKIVQLLYKIQFFNYVSLEGTINTVRVKRQRSDL